MDTQEFYRSLRGRTVSFCGIGGSNLPLVKIFAQKGALVTARDRRSREQLGDTARELESLGVRLVLGEDYLSGLTEEIVFRTPGMKYHLPELEEARRRGAAVTSEMEVFFDLCPCRIVAVTGSDGKTTTTTIIAKMLEAAGRTVHLGGNIGTPLLPRIDEIKPEDIVVAELSSFQLISMRRSPDIAVVTNVTPNHLDMHKDMQEYVDAKKNILLHQNAFSRTVLNADNEITAGFAAETRGQTLLFSRQSRCENGAFLKDGPVVISINGKETAVMKTEEIRIPGAHNVENYMASFCALWGLVPPEIMAQVARTFGGVEHRAELVRELDGVRYYNDSIATTPSRTERGMLSLFPQKIILIAGGYDKKIPFDAFGPAVAAKVKTLVLMGVTAVKIEESVRRAENYSENNPKILHAASLKEAVALCHREAEPGDIVALSPACASFDMFPNYETRGELFRDFVNELK